MKFLDKIRALFSKDPKKIKEVEKTMPEGEGPICWWCEGTVEKHEKKKTFNGKKFHIQCYRLMIKQARGEMGV